MKIILLGIHLAAAGILMGLILLQNSKGGLGGGLGAGEFYRSKRGAERIVFLATIAMTVVFLITSVANIMVQ